MKLNSEELKFQVYLYAIKGINNNLKMILSPLMTFVSILFFVLFVNMPLKQTYIIYAIVRLNIKKILNN
jgi:hypothetical protein